jgi:hypothetical protein
MGGSVNKFVRLGAAVVLGTGMVAAGTATASADTPPQPSVAYAGLLTGGPGAVNVRISYTCYSNIGPINHLFVAVKQGPLVDTDEHSSSEFANTFYSTNWNSDSGPNALTCDGARHTQNIVLKPQPAAFGWTPIVPRLSAGPALVQLCIFDNATTVDPVDGPNFAGFNLNYTMQNVKAGKGASK